MNARHAWVLTLLFASATGCFGSEHAAGVGIPDASTSDVSFVADAPSLDDAADVPATPDGPSEADVVAPPDVPATIVDVVVSADVTAPRDVAAASDAPTPGDAPADVAADVPAPCPAGQVRCDGACTTLGTDLRHCGACGQACATGERCEAGVCRVTCAAMLTLCTGADGTASCVALPSDRAHCGACNRACAATERCAAGACVSNCGAGETACEGACVDTSRSDAHCGGCGRPCADGQTCVAGACRPRCAGTAVLCGDLCDDLTTSARNCGQCGIACAAGQSCVLGRCTTPCPAGQMTCGARCVDLQTDPANCGTCGRRCSLLTTVCRNGACVSACGVGLTSCSGACVDTRTSVDHCGACGNACPARTNATARCAAGACAYTCMAGSGDCDGSTLNGCEASLATTTNCGACGNACRVTGSGIATCAAGRCGVQCLTGRADCDGLYTNGCEVDTRTSAAHCGACGRACAAGASCVAGVCTTPVSRVIEDWESVTWPRTPWVRVGTGSAGTRTATCAQAGAAGVQDPDWIYRTDVTVGATGERLQAWVRRGGSGRAYLGFGANSSGGYSLVAGFNTNDLLIQRNASWAYTILAETPFTGSTNVWYRLELTFNGGGAVTGRIYSATGTVLATVSTTISGLTPGGVALRAFGTTCVDQIERR